MTLKDLAKKYSALEAVDKSDFQRSARILQSMWRAEQGYEIGELKTRRLKAFRVQIGHALGARDARQLPQRHHQMCSR